MQAAAPQAVAQQKAAQIPFNELPRGNGESGAVQEMTDLLDLHGFDAGTRLYDEALALAREGHLGRARDRLNILLCIDPDDALGHLLLGKIYGAQQRWQEALAELAATSACGMRPPQGLKEAFEAQRDAKLQDNRAEQVAARVGAEVRALREEARRLRVDKTRLERAVRDSNRKARSWSLTAVLTTALTVGLLVTFVSSGLSSEPAVLAEATPAFADPIVAEPLVEAVVPTEPHAASLEEILAEIDKPALPVIAAIEPIITSTPDPAAVSKETYVVVSGDNLSLISKKVYGASSKWREIQAANVAVLGNGDSLAVGMELMIPRI
jgi:nucleoid-associated protein YgaU